MLGKKIRTVIRAIFLVSASVIVSIGFVSVFNLTSLKQANAATGPAPGWTTESATPLANQGLTQTVCLTTTNCLGIGITSLPTRPFALYSSSDGGQTWTINPSMSMNGQNGGNLFSPVDELSCPSSTVCYLNNSLNSSVFGSPIYETTNAGTTWTNVSTAAFSGYTVDSLSCVSTTVCVATATSSSNVPSIFVTVNSGSTWTSETVPSSITSSYPFGNSSLSCNTAGLCMIVTKTIPGVSTSSKVILSTDSGSTWTDITSDFGSNVIYGVNCSNFNTAECLATTTGAVYISTNSGTSWTQTTSSPLSGILLATVFCAASSQCYTISDSSNSIFETTNSGSTWTQLTVPASAATSVLISGACVNASDCVVSGSLTSTVETGFTLVTSNGGSTFSYYVISPTGTPSFSSVSCAIATTSCYALTTSGVDYSSNSGATWINESFPSSFFGQGISCPSASTCYVAGSENSASGSTNGVLYTSNSGTTWTYQVFGSGSFISVISTGIIACNSATSCVVANMGFTSSGTQQALYYTTNSGGTWSLGTPPSTVNTSAVYMGITCAISSTDCMIIGQSGSYPTSTYFLEESTNSGSTWSVLSSSSTTSLDVIDCPSSIVCYGEQVANGIQSLVKSTNGGTSWTTLSTTLNALGFSCYSATQCSIYAINGGPTSLQVYTTLDSGANWYSSPLPQVQSENVSLNFNSNSLSCPSSTDCQLVGATATQNVILGLNFAAPSVPLSVSAVVSGTSVGVSWSPPANDGGASPSSYTVSGIDTTTSTSVTSVTLSGNPPGTTVNIPSLTEGDSYIFSVTATNIFGTGPGGTSNSVSIPLIPVISSLSPTSGPAAGGTSVTITGSNFVNTDTVNFGTTSAASVTFVSSTQLTAVSPPGTGTVGITVISGSEGSNSVSFGYTSSGTTTVYNPISPTRICDTRPNSQVQNQCDNGTIQNGPLSAGETLNIKVQGPFGSVTVPTNAIAVVLNVTVTGTTSAGGFLTVYPTGATKPNTSVINFGANDTIANLIQVGVGSNGQVSIYNFNGSTNVIVDLEGYYTSASSTQGLFVPIAPVRVCDTRLSSSIGPNQCNTAPSGTMAANSTLTVNVAGTTSQSLYPGGYADGIPSSAVAVVANITATNTTQAGGFLTVYPTPTGSGSVPVASNLNFGSGISIANRVIVPIGANGDINIYNFNGSTDVIVDINGYFTGPVTTTGSSSFSPIVPTRICDTRAASGTSVVSNQCDNGTVSSGALTPQDTITVQASNISSIPSNATAVVLNVTVTNTTSNGGFLTVYPTPTSGSSTPSNSDLNWSQGETIANQVVVEIGANDSINVYNSVGNTDLIIDVMGYYS